MRSATQHSSHVSPLTTHRCSRYKVCIRCLLGMYYVCIRYVLRMYGDAIVKREK